MVAVNGLSSVLSDTLFKKSMGALVASEAREFERLLVRDPECRKDEVFFRCRPSTPVDMRARPET